MGIENIVAQRAPAVQVVPSTEHQALIADAKAYLVVRHPFWAHLLYNEMVIVFVDDSSGIPVAATDSYYIFVNVPGMIKHGIDSIPKIAFVLAHEISHKVLGHLILNAIWSDDSETKETIDLGNGQFLPYDHDIMNKAKDYIINAMLIQGHVGEFPQGSGLYDPTISQAGMESCVEAYEKIYARAKGRRPGDQPGKAGDPNQPGGHGGFDIHLPPTEQQIEDVKSGKNDQATAAAAAAAEAAGQGDLPGCLKRLLGEILEPHVPWQDHLKSTILRSAGDPAYDFKRIDRRLIVKPDPIYFAPLSHMGAGHIVVGVDTSGSINAAMINRFFAEMVGIVSDLNPQKLTVMWCDAAVHRTDELDEPEDLNELHESVNREGAGGGGGTDFRPVFQRVEEEDMAPDMLVYLTDMFGSFPSHEPDYPVVWASITKGYHAPWGDLVEVDL